MRLKQKEDDIDRVGIFLNRKYAQYFSTVEDHKKRIKEAESDLALVEKNLNGVILEAEHYGITLMEPEEFEIFLRAMDFYGGMEGGNDGRKD